MVFEVFIIRRLWVFFLRKSMTCLMHWDCVCMLRSTLTQVANMSTD